MDNPIRILLVDDQALFREGLRKLIEAETDFEVIGEAGTPQDASRFATHEQPDVILIDPALNCGGNSSIVSELLAAAPNARLIILADARRQQDYRQAIYLGAKGLVLKQETSETLLKAIKKVYAGEMWIERSALESLFAEMVSTARDKKTDPDLAKIQTLTQREREVVTLVTEGLKNKQIAGRLFITEATVSHHLTSIFGKLGVSDRLQLMVYAYRRGLVIATDDRKAEEVKMAKVCY